MKALGVFEEYAVFLDNASIHRSNVFLKYLNEELPHVKVIYNVSRRPDLNGIERFWKEMKNNYRK